MTAHAPKVTPAGVLALLKAHPGRPFGATELADHFDASHTAVGVSARRLVDTGDIRRSHGPRKLVLYHFGALIEKSSVKSTKYVGEVAPAFKRDIWKAPLTGYAARLSAAADLAMAGRA